MSVRECGEERRSRAHRRVLRPTTSWLVLCCGLCLRAPIAGAVSPSLPLKVGFPPPPAPPAPFPFAPAHSSRVPLADDARSLMDTPSVAFLSYTAGADDWTVVLRVGAPPPPLWPLSWLPSRRSLHWLDNDGEPPADPGDEAGDLEQQPEGGASGNELGPGTGGQGRRG